MKIKILLLFCIFSVSVLGGESYLDFARKLAQDEMQRFPELWRCDDNPQPKWEYTPTLMARSFVELYTATGDTAYLRYAEAFADVFIGEDGSILTYKQSIYNMDRVQGGNYLILLNAVAPRPQYRIAIETLRRQFDGQPRTSEGGFWHKQAYPYQMWLDGLFTGTTFYARYTAWSMVNSQWSMVNSQWSDVAKQFLVVDSHTRKANGLNTHGWDESREMAWSNPETGCSAETWGRAEGWYVMALVDVLELMPRDHKDRAALVAILQRVITALEQVQDPKTGLWYQVPDRGGEKGNYIESTCSAMYCYAMAKGARIGVLPSSYTKKAIRVLKNIRRHQMRVEPDSSLSLTNCCAVAGLGGKPYRSGTYDYYIHERIRDNDPKGLAALILAAIELEK